jgi:hypothetical protein
MKAQVSAVSCHLVRVQTGLGTRLQGSAALKTLPAVSVGSALIILRLVFSYWFAHSFVTFHPVFMFVDFFVSGFFTFKREAAGPLKQVAARLHGRTSHDSNVHEHFEILSVEKLMLTRLINKFSFPHGTRSFINVFTTASHIVCAASVVLTYSTICSLELVAHEATFVITVHTYFPGSSKNLISKSTLQKRTNLVWQIIGLFYC